HPFSFPSHAPLRFLHSFPTRRSSDLVFATGRHAELLVWMLVGFIAFFAFSQGAVIWVYISEIFPNMVRAKGQSLGSFTHWIMNRSEEHTSELQSLAYLVCRLLLEKKK